MLVLSLIAAIAAALLAPALALHVWYAIGLSRVLETRGAERWRAWVPLVNDAEIFRLGGIDPVRAVLLVVPVVNIYALVLKARAAHRLGTAVGRGAGTTALALLLPPVWAQVLAAPERATDAEPPRPGRSGGPRLRRPPRPRPPVRSPPCPGRSRQRPGDVRRPASPSSPPPRSSFPGRSRSRPPGPRPRSHPSRMPRRPQRRRSVVHRRRAFLPMSTARRCDVRRRRAPRSRPPMTTTRRRVVHRRRAPRSCPPISRTPRCAGRRRPLGIGSRVGSGFGGRGRPRGARRAPPRRTSPQISRPPRCAGPQTAPAGSPASADPNASVERTASAEPSAPAGSPASARRHRLAPPRRRRVLSTPWPGRRPPPSIGSTRPRTPPTPRRVRGWARSQRRSRSRRRPSALVPGVAASGRSIFPTAPVCR